MAYDSAPIPGELVIAGPDEMLLPFAESWLRTGMSGVRLARTDRVGQTLSELARPGRTIVYVSASGDANELRELLEACRNAQAACLPVMALGSVGLVGPLTRPGDGRGWESAWRQLHRGAVDGARTARPEAAVKHAALLANVALLTAERLLEGEAETPLSGRAYVLDLTDGTGDYHPVAIHPLTNGQPAVRRLEMSSAERDTRRIDEESPALLAALAAGTSPVTGLFARWDEGELPQLPLAQCRAIPADPLSDGPAQLLKETVRSALTHREARLEAGMAGVAAYAERLAGRLKLPDGAPMPASGFDGVGAGESSSEALCRALTRLLEHKLQEARRDSGIRFQAVSEPEEAWGDSRCQYYRATLDALLPSRAAVGWAELDGFPVAWVGSSQRGSAAVGLHATLALRSALVREIRRLTSEKADDTEREETAMEWPFAQTSLFDGRDLPSAPAIESLAETTYAQLWIAASRLWEQRHRPIEAFEIPLPLPVTGGDWPILAIGILERGGERA